MLTLCERLATLTNIILNKLWLFQDVKSLSVKSNLRSSSAGVSQEFCLELSPLTDVSMTLVLAWTDPPSSDGALVHDLDLEVLCDVSSWTVTAWCFHVISVDGPVIRRTHQLRLVVNPSIYKVLYISGGFLAGFLNHQQYLWFQDFFSMAISVISLHGNGASLWRCRSTCKNSYVFSSLWFSGWKPAEASISTTSTYSILFPFLSVNQKAI